MRAPLAVYREVIQAQIITTCHMLSPYGGTVSKRKEGSSNTPSS
jgi:hypothetical protein